MSYRHFVISSPMREKICGGSYVSFPKSWKSLSSYFNLHDAPSVSLESVLVPLALYRGFPRCAMMIDDMQ
jgi:hypothetical protein